MQEGRGVDQAPLFEGIPCSAKPLRWRVLRTLEYVIEAGTRQEALADSRLEDPNLADNENTEAEVITS